MVAFGVNPIGRCCLSLNGAPPGRFGWAESLSAGLGGLRVQLVAEELSSIPPVEHGVVAESVYAHNSPS